MAAAQQVKEYLAYWFQLGKPLQFDRGGAILPHPVIEGNAYSPAFEACWQRVLASGGQGCYLAGTEQSIAELLSGAWDMADCARCEMPVPTRSLGIQSSACPCADLPGWPNTELPQPRSPIDSRSQLEQIRQRLAQTQN
ncbi:MAG: hypothetical protein KME07_10925 [Pegethrix bostrychoides GSE-TBD4-15B]|jgi:hypothetical protein|uniref:Uncharacterized protein n=1 Tax=Pegethrix bostrychoides GSE-TBD4-15B TaxID=2839662 RepID=A0A951PAC0_9CYAN|nr:hypothetical protein [Pegethrix bostrychoides GSE-TBD4-15B]